MARKNESVLNLLVILPWWINVILAFLSYILLKYILPNLFGGNIFIKGFLTGIANVAHI